MTHIEEIIDVLQNKYGCKLVSEIQAFGNMQNDGDITTDIDLFAKSFNLIKIARYLSNEKFILEKRMGIGIYARKFIGNQLYHIDIASMPLILHWFPDIKPTASFVNAIWKDPEVEKFLRYILQFRSYKAKYIKFVIENFETYRHYLNSNAYFNKHIFKKNVSVEDVVGVMEKRPISFFRSFTIARLIRIGWAYILFQLRKIFNHGGEIVAFVGADGSGKTTMLENMSTSIGSHYMYMGENYFYFQKIYNNLFSYPKFFSYITYLFIFIEQWLRYLNIFFKKIKGDRVYVDRWPGFSNFHKSKRGKILGLLFYILFPSPDRFVFLSANPKKIYDRKPELSYEQIKITQKSIRKIIQNKKYIEIVTENYDKSMNKTLEYLLYKNDLTCFYDLFPKKLPTIIEFSGIYASGKTTTAKELIKSLRDSGYSVKNNDDLWDYISQKSKLQRWFTYICNPFVWRFIYKAIITSQNEKIIIPKRRVRWNIWGPTRDTIDRENFIKQNKDIDFIVFDEGTLYVTMDLTWRYNLPVSEIDIFMKSSKYASSANYFLFESNKKLSCNRTGKRQSTSLIDKEPKEIRTHAIHQLMPYCKQSFKYARMHLNTKKVGSDWNMKYRVKRILNYIGL